MAFAGQTLDNPYTGERIVFLQTEQDTGGALLQFEHYMSPRSTPTFGEHVHLNQEETFEIVSGAARYRLKGIDRQAHAGDTVVVARREFHVNCWNPGPGELHMRHALRPPLGAEVFFETLFTLAETGKTNHKGEVSLLQLAVIGDAIPSETFAAGPPIFLQRPAVRIMAAIGRLLGYRARSSNARELGDF